MTWECYPTMFTLKTIKFGRYNGFLAPNSPPKCKFDQIKGAAAEGKVKIFQKVYCLCAIGAKRICVDMFA